MIRLLIQYPTSAGSRFDADYYTAVHLPMARKLLGEYGMGNCEVLEGKRAIDGGSPAFFCITQIEFSSLEGLQSGLQIHGETLQRDFANYTDATPVATVCEIVQAA